MEFVAHVSQHLQSEGVGSIQEQLELPFEATFQIMARAGERFRPTYTMAASMARTTSDLPLTIALFRGGGTLCAVQVIDRAAALEQGRLG